MRKVVVTGAGIVSPIGNTIDEFRERMFAGDSGLTEVRGKQLPHNFPVGAAGLAPRETLGQPSILRRRKPIDTPDFWRLAGLATEEAVASLPSGLLVDGIIYGERGGIRFDLAVESLHHFWPEKFDWAVFRPESGIEIVREIVERHGHGPVTDRDLISISNACVSSNQAIGMAFQRIRHGQWTRAVVGACYSRCTPSEYMNFQLIRTLAGGQFPAIASSRPFSADRSGFVLGEGAATLVLEDRDSAEHRGAAILGEIIGYATTSDAYKMTDGRPDASCATRAIEAAIHDAGLRGEQIDAISAHGTSTRLNDKLETLAIKQALGEAAKRIPVTSLKSQTGHSLIAAGALEAIASLLMLKEQKLAPTINYKEPDPECDLDYVPNQARNASLERILSNSFGFGGQNACVVLQHIPQ